MIQTGNEEGGGAQRKKDIEMGGNMYGFNFLSTMVVCSNFTVFLLPFPTITAIYLLDYQWTGPKIDRRFVSITHAP